MLKRQSRDIQKLKINLGCCYYNGYGVVKDYYKAMQWFTKAAEQGHIQAQYNLGICYTYGHGVEQNHIIAEEWFSKAAQQKN